VGALGGRARADLEIKRLARGFVDELMAVGDAGLEAGGIARAQQRLALVLDQYNLALEDKDEFVLILVPMTLRRGGARFEAREVDAELGQPHRVAERVFLPADDRRLECRRIAAARTRRDLADVDLGHPPAPVARMKRSEIRDPALRFAPCGLQIFAKLVR
jgi:hypothetical protein